MNTFNHWEYGDVEVRTAMFDIDGTNLVEGIEIKFLEEDFPILEIHGHVDINGLEADDVERLIEENFTL